MWTQMLTMDSKCISICRGWMWCSKSMDKKLSVQLLYLYASQHILNLSTVKLIYGGSRTGMNQNPLNYGWTTVTTHYSFWLWMVRGSFCMVSIFCRMMPFLRKGFESLSRLTIWAHINHLAAWRRKDTLISSASWTVACLEQNSFGRLPPLTRVTIKKGWLRLGESSKNIKDHQVLFLIRLQTLDLPSGYQTSQWNMKHRLHIDV